MESEEEREGCASSEASSRAACDSRLVARRDFVLRLLGLGSLCAIMFKLWQGMWAVVFGPRWRITADPETLWGGRVTEVEYRNFYATPCRLYTTAAMFSVTNQLMA